MSMSGQTQDIIKQLSDLFSPRLKEIQDKLETLVTRREHDKDLGEVNADMQTMRREMDSFRTWQDARPRRSADADRVERLEMDIQTLRNRPAQTEQVTRGWLIVALSLAAIAISGMCGGGALLLQLLQYLSTH